MDGRLGTLEPGQKCGTCGNTASRCPGHFGHVELAESVLHMAFVSDINKLIQATCRTCGRILLPQQELDAYRQRLRTSTEFTPTLKEEIAKEILTKAKKVKLCPHCGKQQYQIELTKPTIFHEITGGGRRDEAPSRRNQGAAREDNQRGPRAARLQPKGRPTGVVRAAGAPRALRSPSGRRSRSSRGSGRRTT